MAARRISKSAIDWAAFAQRIPAEQQPQLKAFKIRHDGYVAKVQSLPEQPPAIDWAFYQSKLGDSALVDQFKKAFESVKVPVPQDTLTKEIDAQEQETIVEIKAFVKASEERIERTKGDLKRWEDMLPLHQMTLEEVVLTFPNDSFGLDNKRYQTLGAYDPRFGIPGEKGSGPWNYGPSAKDEKKVYH